jgi:protein TonB
MFKVLNARKRRVISPTTVAASIAAHVLLLGGAVYAAASDTGPREHVEGIVELPPLPTEPPAPKVEPVEPTPPPPAPSPAEPDAPAPVTGEVLQLPAPTEAPRVLAPEPPGTPPVDAADYERDGVVGDVKGPPAVDPRPLTGNTNPSPPGPDFVPDESMVEERPSLNRDGLARTMERFYPSIMRDSRVAGRVVVELIVDVDGRVRPNSATVVEATHPAFGEATLRAVERFRFRPAKMGGVPVPVRVTIPINWTVPN